MQCSLYCAGLEQNTQYLQGVPVPYLFPSQLQVYFHSHHFTDVAFAKVSSNTCVGKSNGQFQSSSFSTTSQFLAWLTSFLENFLMWLLLWTKCVSHQIHMLKPNPQCGVFGDTLLGGN